MEGLRLFALIGLVAYFAVLLFAVMREKKNRNVLDYFFGGRTLPFWALSITFVASWWGAGSAIETADQAYNEGIGAFWYYGVPVLLSSGLLIFAAKAIRRVGYLTQGKMMSARYSPAVSGFLSVLILLFMLFNAASQMVGIGMFFGTYLGMNYEVAVLVGTGIVLIYSMFGGFRGVVLTDIIQFVLLFFSVVAVFAVALWQAGGVSEIVAAADTAGKVGYFSPFAGASKYLAYVITFGSAWAIQANVWQRVSAARNDGDARKMAVLSFAAYIPLYLIVVFTGMAGLALFGVMPEGGVVTAVVMRYMHPVLGALAFVGISAAIMSTMDSLINTAAMTLVLDLMPSRRSETAALAMSRVATLAVTCLALLVSLRIRSILEVSRIASDIITTGIFVPLVMGFFWRRGNTKGALASMAVGFVYCAYGLLAEFGVPLLVLGAPGSALPILAGIGLSLAVYIGVSLCTASEYDKADAFMALVRSERSVAPVSGR